MVKASLKKGGAKPAPATTVTVEPAKPAAAADPTSMVSDAEVVEGPDSTGLPETTTAVATVPKTTLAVSVGNPDEGVEGEWAGTSKLPQLKLVQGSGPTASQFIVGTLIFDNEELLPSPTKKGNDGAPSLLRFVPIKLSSGYREKLSDEQVKEEQLPRTVGTLAEVAAEGGTIYWPQGQPQPDNYWEPAARCTLLLELPEGSDHPSFSLDLDGKLYAVGVYYTAGGSFREFSKPIKDALDTKLFVPVLDEKGNPVKNEAGRIVKRRLLSKNFWTVHFKQKVLQNSKFQPWRPVTRPVSQETGPEIRTFCEEFIRRSVGQSSAPAE